jgi:hypothetical protein
LIFLRIPAAFDETSLDGSSLEVLAFATIIAGNRELEVRLARIQRLRAACAIALLYLLCVMTPTIALALPGTAIPDCLVTDGTAMIHVHSNGVAEHQHRSMRTEHGSAHAHNVPINAMNTASDTPPAQPANHSGGQSCCELMCLTALPAMFPDVSVPNRPVSRCVNEADRFAAGNAPPRLYRPPIS